ncbi:hypothetical protein ACFT5B_03840 [Luteimicrobium sp. NPDC057192]|uniref:hypothetical protein n=1 Tax=Luteimicrobium sp. NPDC057192 TaxID=3346042 RepID=UPI003641B461
MERAGWWSLMGRGNYARASQVAVRLGLDPQPRHVLFRMAIDAKDDDDPPRYYAGWERLAESCGYNLRTLDAKRYAAAKRAITKLVGRLVALGLVERDGDAFLGHRQVYLLHLDLRRWEDQEGRTHDVPVGRNDDVPHGTQSGAQEGRNDDVPNYKTPLPLQGDSKTLSQVSTSPATSEELREKASAALIARLGAGAHAAVAGVMERDGLDLADATIRAAQDLHLLAAFADDNAWTEITR